MENLLDYSLRIKNIMYFLCDERTTSEEISMLEDRLREIYEEGKINGEIS
jgi:hypothetical protein